MTLALGSITLTVRFLVRSRNMSADFLLVYDLLKAGHSMEEPFLQSMLYRYQGDQYTALKERMQFTVQVRLASRASGTYYNANGVPEVTLSFRNRR